MSVKQGTDKGTNSTGLTSDGSVHNNNPLQIRGSKSSGLLTGLDGDLTLNDNGDVQTHGVSKSTLNASNTSSMGLSKTSTSKTSPRGSNNSEIKPTDSNNSDVKQKLGSMETHKRLNEESENTKSIQSNEPISGSYASPSPNGNPSNFCNKLSDAISSSDSKDPSDSIKKDALTTDGTNKVDLKDESESNPSIISPSSTSVDNSTSGISSQTFELSLKKRGKKTSSKDLEAPTKDPVTPKKDLKSSEKDLESRKTPKERRPFVHVAPLSMPLKHRLETVGIIWHVISIPVFFSIFLGVLALGRIVWLVVILPYFIWWYGFDLHTPTNGKVVYRTREWMRNVIIWEWFVNYFPIRVHKSCELEPTFTQVAPSDGEDDLDDEQDLISESSRTIIDNIFKMFGLRKRLNVADSKQTKYKTVSSGPRYIFGYHPHGVISMGVMGTFATNAVRNEPFEPPLSVMKPLFHDPSKGERVFPGIGHIFPLTLTTQFTIPFYRDYLLGLGLTSASAKNIRSLINNGDNSVCIVVGGAQESLLNNIVTKGQLVGHGFKGDFAPDSRETRTIQLVLNKRKGFVKLAIELGNVSLVPIFGFGEVDIYKLKIPEPGSWGYTFQHWMKKTFLFTLPFFSARGVFIYDFGLIPYRHPINMCFGRPIHIPEHALADYKRQHQEEDDEEEPDEKHIAQKKERFARTDSITNLFKLKKPRAEKKKKKTKVPQPLLDHYHKLYVDELKRVYEENKDRFGYGDVELVIGE